MIVTSQQLTKDLWSPIGRSCKTQDYYVVRQSQASYVSYWGLAVDPDGKERDRLSEMERQQFVGDMWEELAFLNSQPIGAICDVGCGPGWLLRELSGEWFKVGVDICDEALDELRKHQITAVRTTRELPECAFDVVVAHHVVEHMTDPIYQIGNMRSILKPGGWLVLGTPDFGSPCAVRFGEQYRMLHDPTHVSLFTLESMHRFLRDNGFTIHDVKFPFPARHATAVNFARWADTTQVSPPWPGNWLTFYATRS
jgi:2-polyprenyl-3-methyl-5-hydroxy-6-metoxy-1,4-benzoquinol methylase